MFKIIQLSEKRKGNVYIYRYFSISPEDAILKKVQGETAGSKDFRHEVKSQFKSVAG